MTDEAALHRAVLCDPADDTVRLLYAEELDENSGMVECGACGGQGRVGVSQRRPNGYFCPRRGPDCSGRISDGRAERAEFIRVQVELAREYPDEISGKRGDYLLTTANGNYCRLRRRERELFRSDHISHFLPEKFGATLSIGETWHLGPPPTALVSRGFVSRLSCSWAAWLAHHAAIYWEPGQGRDCPRGAQPIEEVRLTSNRDEIAFGVGGCLSEMLGWTLSTHRFDGGIQRGLVALWPRIKFVLPTERDRRILPDQPIHWDDAGPPIPARADTEETR